MKQWQSQPHVFCLTYRTDIDPIWPQEKNLHKGFTFWTLQSYSLCCVVKNPLVECQQCIKCAINFTRSRGSALWWGPLKFNREASCPVPVLKQESDPKSRRQIYVTCPECDACLLARPCEVKWQFWGQELQGDMQEQTGLLLSPGLRKRMTLILESL